MLMLAIVVPVLLAMVMLIRAGGGLRVDPGIDWSAYPASVHDAIDLAAKNADCAGLARQRAGALSRATGAGADPSPLVAYIDTIRQQLVCPR
ncbi:MAG TPA: hypothetical protein VGK16_14305 [Candidatus Limnocylindrales bacterium]